MTTTNLGIDLPSQLNNSPTGAIDDKSLGTTPDLESHNRDAWQRMIDDYLIEWGRNPEQLADEEEGLEAPTEDALRSAIEHARNNAEKALPAPLRVVSDGDGGISFERRDGDWHQSLDILPDGTAELVTIKNYCFVDRILVSAGITSI